MLEVKVTITLAPEVLTILQGLIGQAGKANVAINSENVAKKVSGSVEPVKQQEKEPKVSYDELMETAKKIIKAGKREELKKILDAYGATGVSKLDKKQYEEVYKELKALIHKKKEAA